MTESNQVSVFFFKYISWLQTIFCNIFLSRLLCFVFSTRFCGCCWKTNVARFFRPYEKRRSRNTHSYTPVAPRTRYEELCTKINSLRPFVHERCPTYRVQRVRSVTSSLFFVGLRLSGCCTALGECSAVMGARWPVIYACIAAIGALRAVLHTTVY